MAEMIEWLAAGTITEEGFRAWVAERTRAP
jgi:hypothetical protein